MRKITCSILILFSNFSFGQNCDNWLATPNYISAVNIGKLNVAGNQITVEATIYQTAVNPVFGTGDIVSKHTDPSDDNYLLRPDNCSITTTNGFYETAGICKVENNRIYHVAMVYDGKYLRFYRNGFLMSEIAATGNLIQNDRDTRIGYYAYQWWNQQFFGYINEVRIWNIARTAAEIKAYINTSLPSPTTQSGLLAYYTFDNLINKQGNPSWNGTLAGNASISQQLPTCNFIADSCNIKPLTSTIIINDYTEVSSLNICNNELIVKDASKYNPGDTVVIIQMKGASTNSSNTSVFGTVTDYKNSGNYEFNIIKGKNGNRLSLLNVLERNYDIPDGKVQLIRVPYYTTANITSTLTCLPWDGSKGGVLVLNARDGINLSADIDVTGRGFKGGNSPNPKTTALYCNYNEFYYPANTQGAAAKGESISDISSALAWGKGSNANGGGGGNGHNSGGGGGSNGGAGGYGGYQLDACGNAIDNRGTGGNNLPYNNVSNKIFLGGGGGSGHTDNAGGSDMNGANGGGIVIIKSPKIISANNKIVARGADIINCALSPIDLCHDANGGGGGGGSVLIESTTITNNITVDVSGGKGGDLVIFYLPNASRIGPGGGGGGGVFWINSASISPNITVIKNGGKNGVIIADANNAYGTTPGQDGIDVFNLKIPVATTLFKPNIDSVRIKEALHDCNIFELNGLPFVQTSPINNWQWSFGDGSTSNAQNVTHTYATAGSHNLKLVATDINGCKDSVLKVVTTSILNLTKSADTSLCGTSPVKIFAAGGSTYSWSPTAGLDNANISNPVATPLASTKYYVTVFNADGCSKTDSIRITVNSLPVVSKSNDTSICKNSKATLLAGGGSSYNWTPASSLNNPGIATPVATPLSNTTYIVKVTNINGCSKIDSIKVTINPVPVITKSKDTTVCNNTSIKIFVAGGNSYLWSPASTLDNPSSAAPTASPLSTTVYHVAITDAQFCTYNDSVKINVRDAPIFSVSPDNSVCQNTPHHLSASGGSFYSWSPATFLDDPTISNPVAIPGASITYAVTIKENICNESATLFTKLTVIPLPNVKARKSNDITCFLPSSHLAASGAQNYIWTPAASLNNGSSAGPVATPTATTLYTVTGKDLNGCSNSDTVSVQVAFNINTLYGLPNSFTPNGDGLNDCFGVKYWGQVDELDFNIYNRFGERVFHTNNAANCWDGRYKGQLQDPNIFVYTVKAKTACGKVDKKGTVMLLK